MIDIKKIIADMPLVEAMLRKRGQVKLIPTVTNLVDLDRQRRETLQSVEALKAKRNTASHEIATLKKQKADATALLEEMKKVSEDIKRLDEKVAEIQQSIQAALYELPNLLHSEVPEGMSSAQNVEVRRWGNPVRFSFPPKSHDDIGEKMGIMDFKKAGEVTGARFVFLKGMAARLERALIQFMLDSHLEKGYTEILPPFMVNRQALFGTGHLPKFEEDVFKVEKFEYFLVPTAEVPVTNYHQNEILEEKELPKRYVAFTPCFRSEAGSYGKDTKGLKRQHQFDKVELVKFTTQETSEKELQDLVTDAESILQKLNLAYRVVILCSADTGFASAKTYDLEVWSPFSQTYVEISSCSTYTDFQARRANIRYRDGQGRVQFVHTINGSGLAVGRTLLAIIENYQKPDGTFDIPDALQPYLM